VTRLKQNHTVSRLSLLGGPGASSLFGSFIENGPVDVYGNTRNTSWTLAANMLFVDNPIGTGKEVHLLNAIVCSIYRRRVFVHH
jgi:carboxypeptidase C (cathepsin A)